MKAFVARRTLWTVLAVFLVLSATFFALALTPDPQSRLAQFGAAVGAAAEGEDPNQAAQEAAAAYAESRNRDRPLLDRWAGWMVGYATGDWGWSYTYDRPVTDVLAKALPLTLAYLLPGIALASLLSVLSGAYGALERGGVVDRFSRAVTFAGLALPSFFLAVIWSRSDPAWGPMAGLAWSSQLLTVESMRLLLGPALIVGLNLFAVQAWVVRSETLEIAPSEFVKTLRASGAGDVTVARHVLRNAASPLLAMFVSEVLVILYVTVFVVEIIFNIPGLGLVGFAGFEERDFGVVLAVVMLPVVVGLLANLAKDVLTVRLDPRVSEN